MIRRYPSDRLLQLGLIFGWLLVAAFVLFASGAWAAGEVLVEQLPPPGNAWQAQLVGWAWTLVVLPLVGWCWVKVRAWLAAKAVDAKASATVRQAAAFGVQLASIVEPVVRHAEVDLRPEFTVDGKLNGAKLKQSVVDLVLKGLAPAVRSELEAHFGDLLKLAVSGAVEVAVAGLPPRKETLLAEAVAAGGAVKPKTLDEALTYLAQLRAKLEPAAVTP